MSLVLVQLNLSALRHLYNDLKYKMTFFTEQKSRVNQLRTPNMTVCYPLS